MGMKLAGGCRYLAIGETETKSVMLELSMVYTEGVNAYCHRTVVVLGGRGYPKEPDPERLL
jgi:hypothetical protein